MGLLRRLRSDEQGFALVIALAVTVVFSMTVITVIESASSNSRAADRSKGRMSAYSLAEAGINNAASILRAGNAYDQHTLHPQAPDQPADCANPTPIGDSPAMGNTCAPFSWQYDGGTVTMSGVLNPTTGVWAITSTGTVRNAFASQNTTRTLTATVRVRPDNTQPKNVAAWNYIISRNTSDSTTCDMEITNNAYIDAPLYVAGNLCIDNNAQVYEPNAADPVSLTVMGKLAIWNNGKVGVTAASPITNGAVGTGCASSITGATHACSQSTDPYYVRNNLTATALTLPVADYNGFYTGAALSYSNPCDAATRAGSYPTWDNNGVINISAPNANGSAATFDLTPGTSYTCKRFDSSGVQIGELSWNASTKTLTVMGTMYFDGSMTASNGSTNLYNGSGTLYLSGTFQLFNNTKLCANAACDFNTWNPNTEMFIIVAHGNSSGDGIMLYDAATFEGGLYADNAIRLENNTTAMGPMMGAPVKVFNNVTLKPLPAIDTLPLGAPGNPNTHASPSTPSYGGG